PKSSTTTVSNAECSPGSTMVWSASAALAGTSDAVDWAGESGRVEAGVFTCWSFVLCVRSVGSPSAAPMGGGRPWTFILLNARGVVRGTDVWLVVIAPQIDVGAVELPISDRFQLHLQ